MPARWLIPTMAENGYEIVCPHCRAGVPSRLEVCPSCGKALSSAPEPPVPLQAGPVRAAIDVGGPAAVTVRGRLEPEATATAFGGFWIRVAAYLIDSLVLLVPIGVLQYELGAPGQIVAIVGAWLYFALLESSSGQGTIGKMALGLAVEHADGGRISFARATGRYFAKILSAIPLGLGFLIVGWTSRKRGLHDLLAGTVVIRR
ncbi:MAG: RDD family protein [Gaiellaceae bacterium]